MSNQRQIRFVSGGFRNNELVTKTNISENESVSEFNETINEDKQSSTIQETELTLAEIARNSNPKYDGEITDSI